MKRALRFAMFAMSAAFAMFGVAMLAGCSKAEDPKLVQMKKVHDQVCTCVDGACIEMAMKGMPKTRPDDLKEAERLGREILACIDAHPTRREPPAPAPEPTPAAAPVEAPPAPVK